MGFKFRPKKGDFHLKMASQGLLAAIPKSTQRRIYSENIFFSKTPKGTIFNTYPIICQACQEHARIPRLVFQGYFLPEKKYVY